MNEHSFVRSFHKRLSNEVFIWKIHDPYQGGVPDALLVGRNGKHLFIEYKFIRSLPKRSTTKVTPALSPQQSQWLNDKISRGLSALVILGSQDGVVIFRAPDEWDPGLPKSDCSILTPKEAASQVETLLGVHEHVDRELEVQSVSKEAS